MERSSSNKDMTETLLTVNGVHPPSDEDSLWTSITRRGLLLALTSSLLFSISQILTENYLIVQSFRLNDIYLFIHCTHAFLTIPYVSHIRNSIEVPRNSWKVVLLSGLMVTLTAILMSVAATNVEITSFDVSSVVQFQCLVVFTSAFLVVNEIPSVIDLFIVLFMVLGIILAARPSYLFHSEHPSFTRSYAVGMVCAALASISNVIANFSMKIVKSVPATVIIAVQSIVAVLIILILDVRNGSIEMPSTAIQWLFLITVSILLFFARLTLIMALCKEHVLHVTVLNVLELPINLIFRHFVEFGMQLDRIQILGIFTVFASVLVIFFEKYCRKFCNNLCSCLNRRYEQLDSNNERSSLAAAKQQDFSSLYTLD